jgi:hypothetical protein
MPIESATYVNQLDQTRPTATDVKSEGDDVMRLIKSTLKNSLPNIGGAVNASHTELNRMVGASEDVQPRLSASLSAPNGETLNRLPAAASRQGGYLTFNASTGQPEVGFSLATASGNTLGIFNASNVTTFFTAGSERMRVNESGNVAIGTTAPDVFGRAYGGAILGISKASGQSAIALNSSVGSAFLEMGVGGARMMSVIASSAEASVSSVGARPLVLGSDSVERMRVDANGNIGFGTATPDLFSRSYGGTILGISKGSGQSAIAINSATGSAFLEMGVGGTRYGAFTVSATDTQVSHGSTLILATNSVNRVVIDSTGNVISNVNTTAPTLTTNQQMVFALTSNTNLRISVRGTDGTTRVANITLA